MSLPQIDLRTIYETILRIEQARKTPINNLSDLFIVQPRLIISPNNTCAGGCQHCVADSTLKKINMSYDKFTHIDENFFKIFSTVDIGRRGNSLLYQSNGHDLVDLLTFLNDQGINKFTLALTFQNNYTPLISRLENFVAERQVPIETMITYHHYYPNLDSKKLAQNFNSTLKNYSGFSTQILISLLGDEYSQQLPTKAEEVQHSFQDNQDIIFADINLTPKDNNTYLAQYKNKELEIFIPSLDTRVYPLGRFRTYLDNKGILPQYEHDFNQSMSDYVCPDLIKWPGIIIEPDGSLNLCASFEAIACQEAIVTNIFTNTYAQVQEQLTQFHQKELRWFIDNLDNIIAGKISTCKLKNHCYQ